MTRPDRVTRIADRDEQCRRCSTAIAKGAPYWQTVGGPVHPACLRLRITPTSTSPRYRFDPHEGKGCPGCGFTLSADDEVVHVSAVPWHRECRTAWTGGR